MIRRDPSEAGVGGNGDAPSDPPATDRARIRWWLAGLTAAAIAAVVCAFLAIPWYPVVLPDSLAYLDHAGDLLGGGLVEFGFRQVGYPLWLAATGGLGTLVGLQPLHAMVVAQLLLFAAAMVVAARVLGWWAVPVVGVLCLPTMLAYANLLLTESIGVPIAVISASAVVAVARFPRGSRSAHRWMAVGYAGAAILPIIRLHYGLISVAVVVGILWSRDHLDRSRRAIGGAVAVAALIGALVVGLTIENRAEQGVANPSLGSERALYWVLYESIVPDRREAVSAAAPEVYRDGHANTLLVDIDRSGLPYEAQQERYRSAIETILAATGESLLRQRFASSLAAVAGGRLDDIGGIVLHTSGTGGGPRSIVIHQYASVRNIDTDWFADTYNAGTVATPIRERNPRDTTLHAPYIGTVIRLLAPIVTILSAFLVVRRRARGPALAVAITMFGYAIASFLFVFDNFRYLLPPYLFAITAGVGAVMLQWGRSGSEGSSARDPSTTRVT